MAHLRHHEDMGDLGLALLSSGTTVFLAMISAFFAIRLFRELRPPPNPEMQGVLQLDIPGLQPFRPFSGQGHRLHADPKPALGPQWGPKPQPRMRMRGPVVKRPAERS